MLAEVWRYPVKSCAGERLAEAHVGASGVAGDRSWAVVDAQTGLVASAKRPSLWGQLLMLDASIQEDHLTIRFPSGESCGADDPVSAGVQLSSFLNRRVVLKAAGEIESPSLERTDPDLDAPLASDGGLALRDVATGALGASAPGGSVFDFAPLHVISTPTLDALVSAGTTAGDVRRFRPNLVVDVDGPAFQENEWPGQRLVFGTGLELKVLIQSPRCVVPSLSQAGLPRSVATLRTLASLNRIEIDGFGRLPCAGIYASVVHAGRAVQGSGVSFLGGAPDR